jgi:hypothetical protein
MIYELESKYEVFIKNILKSVPILRAKQLIICLEKSFEECASNKELSLEILKALQRKGMLMLTYDGYVMTRGAYVYLTNDKFFDNVDLNDNIRIKDKMAVIRFEKNNKRIVTKTGDTKDLIDRREQDLIDAMWIAADMMPGSKDFIVSAYPWLLTFINEEQENSKLFEITKISSKNETAKVQLLKRLPVISDPETRETVRRIAIVDNPEHAWAVPYVGLKYICVLDEDCLQNYRVIEKRENDILWKDYE